MKGLEIHWLGNTNYFKQLRGENVKVPSKVKTKYLFVALEAMQDSSVTELDLEYVR